LYENYVEDDDNMFRFDYSREFLLWALTPPGYFKDWHIGVRVVKNKKLVGFITGIPCHVHAKEQKFKSAEINFLCVHKKLRSNRLAPVLIKEVTRRVNLKNIWQAVYTAGTLIPTPVTQARYYHRSLNPKKLIDVNFE
jgi:glycylpeptide N-tetradecanoyltransferase